MNAFIWSIFVMYTADSECVLPTERVYIPKNECAVCVCLVECSISSKVFSSFQATERRIFTFTTSLHSLKLVSVPVPTQNPFLRFHFPFALSFSFSLFDSLFFKNPFFFGIRFCHNSIFNPLNCVNVQKNTTEWTRKKEHATFCSSLAGANMKNVCAFERILLLFYLLLSHV